MKLFLTKTRAGLTPLTDEDRKALQAWPLGQTRQVDCREKRNPQHHRKLFGMLRKVVDNSEDFETTQALLTAIKVKLGHVDVIRGFDGEMLVQARSVAFAEMDQDEFNGFYDGALRLCATYLGVSEVELETEAWK